MLLQNGSQPNPEKFAQDYAARLIETDQELKNVRIQPYPHLTGQPSDTVSSRNDYFT